MKTALMACLVLCAQPLIALAAPVFTDDFNDNQISSSWVLESTGGQPYLQEANSRLEFTIPATSTGSFFGTDVRMANYVLGDFDVQVDYALLNWPANNGVRAALVVNRIAGGGAGVERISRTPNDYDGLEDYTTDIGGQITRITTTSLSGTIRLVAAGSTITGYYLDSGNWVKVGSGPWAGGQAYLALAGWSHDSVFGHQQVRFAFDNFQVNSAVFPEPATLALLSAGGLAIVRRRRAR